MGYVILNQLLAVSQTSFHFFDHCSSSSYHTGLPLGGKNCHLVI
jgi:hypothetical protein